MHISTGPTTITKKTITILSKNQLRLQEEKNEIHNPKEKPIR